MTKADELWEKYGNKFADIAVNQTVRVAQRVDFLAALAEYGEAVRAEAVKEKPKEIDPNKWAFDRGLESY